MMAGATIVLLAILAFLLLSDPNANSTRLPATRFAGALRPDSPPARFSLINQDGKMITAASLRGQPVIVAFMYSTCQNDCPTMAQRFLAAQHLGGRMNFLLGSDQKLQPTWRAFGIEPQRAGREHTAIVVLLDASGHQRIGFPLSELTPEAIAHDVRVLQREATSQSAAQ